MIAVCIRENFPEAVACSRVCGIQVGREEDIPDKGSCSLSKRTEEYFWQSHLLDGIAGWNGWNLVV